MNIGLVSEQVIMGILMMTAIALSTKFVGCFTAALAKVRDIMGATRISVGMIPRGELSLIIASIALSKGIVAESVYVQTVSMVILTSIIAPTILSRLYRVSQKGGGGEQVKELGAPPPPPKPGPESGVEVS